MLMRTDDDSTEYFITTKRSTIVKMRRKGKVWKQEGMGARGTGSREGRSTENAEL